MENECTEYIRNSTFIKNICNRRTGVGADCVIIISESKDCDFKMDYFNSDGTWETFCANGARCAVKLLYEKKYINNKSSFMSGDGIHKAIVSNKGISIKMNTPSFISDNINVEGFEGYIIDSGALHFCTQVKQIHKMKNLEKIGRKIRNSDIFKPRGINVNFFEKINNNTLDVITYEKGVERLMLSCGSGSLAALFYASKNYDLSNVVDCMSEGGKLKISYDKDWKNVWLSGDTVLLFESFLNEKHFK